MQNTDIPEFCRGGTTQSALEKQAVPTVKSVQNTDMPEFCTGGITQSAPGKEAGSSVQSVQNTDTTEFCTSGTTQSAPGKEAGSTVQSVQNTDIPEFCTSGTTQNALGKQAGTRVQSVQNTDIPEFCTSEEGDEGEEMSQAERQMYQEKIAFLERENQLLREQLAHANSINNDVVKVLDQEQSLHLLSHKENDRILPEIKLPKAAIEQFEKEQESLTLPKKNWGNWWKDRDQK
ncbi:hypothetical protein BZK37_17710 [Enterococcus casseliflavus]|nr:hypothetical protein BZK37_17710 [Enterococcus casseliflavus]